MLTYSEALEIVIREASAGDLPMETTPLVLSAGRILASDIIATESLPSFDNSAMDGYAIVASDTAGATTEAPVTLRVIGESAAGAPFPGSIDRSMAVRIMTGAAVPTGADGVVEVETTHEADGYVTIRQEIQPGRSIRLAGEDITEGGLALGRGTKITPGGISLLAALGVTMVPVRVKPIVGILSTGNELVEPHRTPGPGQLRNCSLPALYAACREAGAEAVAIGIVSDDRDELREKIEEALRYDILLTTGGVSAGAYDYVTTLLPELGVDILFHRIAIRPGSPLLFGVHRDAAHATLVFGLPGNPVSTLVTFDRFVRPAIRHLLTETTPSLELRAALDVDIRKKDVKRHFVRGVVEERDGALHVRPTATQSSGAVTSIASANCLIVLEEDVHDVAAGSSVITIWPVGV